MNLEQKTLNMEVKELREDGTFTGMMSVYDVIDEYRDVVERGAYTKTITENGGRLPLLWQHDPAMPIGSLAIKDGEDGLEVEGKLLLADEVPEARKAYALLKAGIVRGLSIGFKAIRKKTEDNIRRLKEIKLYEGSLVTIPANRFALVTAVKALRIETKDFNAELEQIQLMDQCYQIMTALRWAIGKVMHDPKISNEDKQDAATETIDQFRSAFLAFLPRYLASAAEGGMGYMSAEELVERLGSGPDELRATLTAFSKGFLEQHPGTLPRSAASAALPTASVATLADSITRWQSELASV
jgi:hypothetical protein